MDSHGVSAGSPPPRELHGWKEISDFLGVTVRRAEQWEAELQLPIRRIQLGQRAKVIALTSELEDWRRRRMVVANLPQPAEPVAPTAGARSRRHLVAAAVAGPLLGLLAWFLSAAFTSAPPTTVVVRDGLLEARDARQRVVWRRTLSDRLEPRHERVAHTSKASGTWISNVGFIDDIDGDGAVEVVAVETLTPPMGRIRRETVYCFDAGGHERWKFAVGRPVSWNGRQFDDAFSVHWMAGPFDYMGRRALVVGAQNLFFPFQIAVLDATSGEIVGEYWHTGGLSAVLLDDSNRDGRVEILAGGVNNPGPGQGLPALARLYQPLPGPMRDHDDVFRLSARARVDYILFPPMRAFTEDTLPRRVHWIRGSANHTIELAVSSGPERDDLGQTLYAFAPDLSVQAVQPDDLVRGHYDRLFHAGTIDDRLTEAEIASWSDIRRFTSVPNANAPDIRALWPAFPDAPSSSTK